MWLVFSFPLFALLITDGGCFEEMDLSGFTQSLMDLANNTLGVQIMQVPWAAWLLLAPCCLKHFPPAKLIASFGCSMLMRGAVGSGMPH